MDGETNISNSFRIISRDFEFQMGLLDLGHLLQLTNSPEVIDVLVKSISYRYTVILSRYLVTWL